MGGEGSRGVSQALEASPPCDPNVALTRTYGLILLRRPLGSAPEARLAFSLVVPVVQPQSPGRLPSPDAQAMVRLTLCGSLWSMVGRWGRSQNPDREEGRPPPRDTKASQPGLWVTSALQCHGSRKASGSLPGQLQAPGFLLIFWTETPNHTPKKTGFIPLLPERQMDHVGLEEGGGKGVFPILSLGCFF